MPSRSSNGSGASNERLVNCPPFKILATLNAANGTFSVWARCMSLSAFSQALWMETPLRIRHSTRLMQSLAAMFA